MLYFGLLLSLLRLVAVTYLLLLLAVEHILLLILWWSSSSQITYADTCQDLWGLYLLTWCSEIDQQSPMSHAHCLKKWTRSILIKDTPHFRIYKQKVLINHEDTEQIYRDVLILSWSKVSQQQYCYSKKISSKLAESCNLYEMLRLNQNLKLN